MRFHGAERIIERIHEDPAHHIDHQHAAAAGRLVEIAAAPRCRFGIIDRAQDAIFLVDVSENFLLVGPVIAGGNHVYPHGEIFLGDGAGEAEAARRIFAIGDDQVGLEGGFQGRQLMRHGIAARLADHIAQEKNIHRAAPENSLKPCSVRMPSSAISCGSCGSEAVSCAA